MPAAPLPSNERARLAALREYAILDSEAERRYDDIAAVATYVCNTPMAAVSLIDESRQWFKSRIGIDSSETPREEAFCAHAILDDALLVVDDAREDPRFRDNPLVLRNPQVRFYAGAPLVVHGGFRLGTLCAIALKRRSWNSETPVSAKPWPGWPAPS